MLIRKVKENQSLVTRTNHNKQTKHHLKRARETSDQVKLVIWNDRAITVIVSLSPYNKASTNTLLWKMTAQACAHHCHLGRVWETSDQASKIWPGKAPDMKGYNLLSLSCRFHLKRDSFVKVTTLTSSSRDNLNSAKLVSNINQLAPALISHLQMIYNIQDKGGVHHPCLNIFKHSGFIWIWAGWPKITSLDFTLKCCNMTRLDFKQRYIEFLFPGESFWAP